MFVANYQISDMDVYNHLIQYCQRNDIDVNVKPDFLNTSLNVTLTSDHWVEGDIYNLFNILSV